MAKYKYNGTDITNLINSGSESITEYTGFPAYTTNSRSTERPLPFKFNFKNPSNVYVDVSTLMNAKSHDYSSGTASLTIPTDYNAFRAIIIGGGGGGGGGGGCGWRPKGTTGARTSAGGGSPGGTGKFIMIENATPITSVSTLYYTVGEGGGGGTGGGDRDKGPVGTNHGPGGKGNGGKAGSASSITATIGGTSYTIYANGGNGGKGGDAGGSDGGTGNGEGGGGGGAAPSSASNYSSITDYSASIPTDVNPLNYKIATNGNGIGGGGGPGGAGNGDPGGAGRPGYIRIYLLKS